MSLTARDGLVIGRPTAVPASAPDDARGTGKWRRASPTPGRGRVPLVAIALLAVALVAPGSVLAATPATYVLRTGLPDRMTTPGALNPAVTQATIHSTICVRGWTATIRPPASYTTALKIRQLATYGYKDRTLSHYEEDHLVSLELGGNPRSASNLWPEPHDVLVGGMDVGSYAKDDFENYLRSRVCAGRMTLALAQRRIAVNWVYYWKRWKGL